MVGNFAYDRQSRLLTYRAVDDQEMASFAGKSASVAVPQLVEVLVVEGAGDLLFQNIVVEGAAVDMSACLAGACDAQKS